MSLRDDRVERMMVLHSLRSCFKQNSECGEPIQLDAPLDRDPDQASTLRVSKLDYHRIGSNLLPTLRIKIFLLLTVLGPKSFTSEPEELEVWDSTLDLSKDVLRLISLTHRAFQSFRSTQNLPVSDDSQDATILIPYDRFDIILAFHGSIINLLSNLMKAYQTYLRSIDSIPVDRKQFPIGLWQEVIFKTANCSEIIDRAVNQIAQSDYQFFVDDCRYSIGTITNLTKRYSDLLLRADAESRLTPLGPVQVIRLDHDPIDGQGNDENNNGNNNSSSIDNDENNSSDNANLNSSSNNNNTEIVDEEFPGYIFVVPDIHLTRIRNLLKVLELFILFINKVSRKDRQRLRIIYRLSVTELADLSEEFKDWGYVADTWGQILSSSPPDLIEAPRINILDSLRAVLKIFLNVRSRSCHRTNDRPRIGSDRRIEYDDPSLDVREKFGSEVEESEERAQLVAEKRWIECWFEQINLATRKLHLSLGFGPT
ncbi:hypothetical protein PPACK8108_LOCUS14046 [Phakopsora pachyrhizi]|uniref:Spindle pole body component n=1 Tax=Phakopsora pachyrhizi TaxID=170000 RepID=A0AAV0B400_PHAPC|nr:hypothetical protein PPACK8108_LOCUS12541 [Phakopsora pachyrhizi]CAH7681454.1 hypothetical protein PPACK8108_LOCUS14046 [Phakopsora pachyrhizi]